MYSLYMIKNVYIPTILITVFLTIAGGVWWWYLGSPSLDELKARIRTPIAREEETPAAETSQVFVAFLDTAGTTNGKERGCDKVVMVPYTIDKTRAPLTIALFILFDIDEENANGLFSYIARTNDTLAFDRATVVDGTAHIYLTGSLTGLAGVCDDPRAAIQIEETALQFPTVQRVQLYLNEEPTTLIPDMRGE